MDWKDYFNLTVVRETQTGSHKYFQAQLLIPDSFSMGELHMKEFEYLKLNENEKKLFTLSMRKILLRHKYFKSREFDRLVENFKERLIKEKEQLLTFSTSGGGIYLFMALLADPVPLLQEKKLVCLTSERPLDVISFSGKSKDVHFIIRPHARSYFGSFPTLWSKSNLIDLFEINEA